jgi:hypothetical protein
MEHQPFERGLGGKASAGARLVPAGRPQWRRFDGGQSHLAAIGEQEGFSVNDACHLTRDAVPAGAIG